MMDADAVLAQGLALFQQEQRVVYQVLTGRDPNFPVDM